MMLRIVLAIACILSAAVESQIFDNSLAPPTMLNKLNPIQFKPKCTVTGKALDLLFVVDSSGSLREDGKFKEELDVIRALVNQVAVGQNSTRVGLVQYSGIARTEFHFNTFDYRQYILEALDTLRPMYGVTKTGNALFHAVNELTAENGMRGPEVPKIVFLLSDGRTSDAPRDLDGGNALRSKGASMYGYATGVYAAAEELVAVTRNGSHVFTYNSLDQMKAMFREYEGREVCEQVPVCVPGSNQPVDLLIVIDSSQSVANSFSNQVEFIKDYVLPFINVHPDAVRLAVIQFAGDASLVFGFNVLKTNEGVAVKIAGLNDVEVVGTTRIDRALNLAASVLQNDPGRRNNTVEKIVIVLTDGHSQTSLRNSVLNDIRNLNLTIFAVALSPNPETDVLSLIANRNTGNVFTSQTKDLFLVELRKHVNVNCPGSATTPTERSVQGPIESTCNANSATFTVRFRKNFVGRVYAQDYFKQSGCFVLGDGRTDHVTLTLYANTCGLKREFVDYPRSGSQYNATLVLQFHPDLVTVIDQSIDFSCFFESSSSLQQVGELRMRPADSQCTYTIRRYEEDGCVALDARVGENLIHRWQCDDDGVHKFVVHDCFVQTSDLKEAVKLVDDQGCTIDQLIFDTPTYSDNPSVVLAKEQSIRLPGSGDLKYKCKISFCDDKAGQCINILPPKCDEKRLERAALERAPRIYSRTVDVETHLINVVNTDKIKPTKAIQFCQNF